MVKSIMRCLAIIAGVLFLLGAAGVPGAFAQEQQDVVMDFQEMIQMNIDSADEQQLAEMWEDLAAKQQRCAEITDKPPGLQQLCEDISEAVVLVEEAMEPAE
jgi:hypothetical protein